MRTLLIAARKESPEEPLVEVDRAGFEGALLEVLQKWVEGEPPPKKPVHIEKAQVESPDGEVQGFNYYLCSEEPMIMGHKLRVEVEDGGISPEQAAALAESEQQKADPFAGFDPDDSGATGVLTEIIMRTVYDLVRERSKEGRRSIFFEPFAGVPAKMHPEKVEDEIMAKVVLRLQAKMYKDVEWDRRDGRVILRVAW